MKDYSLTEESARKIKKLINEDRYQPPRRHHNTRPTDNSIEETHFLYTLTSATDGTIRNMADTVEIEAGVAVINTLSMFSDQVAGDRGICVRQAGVYYRIQAPCKT